MSFKTVLSMPQLRAAAKATSKLAKTSNHIEDHLAASQLFKECGDRLLVYMEARNIMRSDALGYYGDMEEWHRSKARELRRKLKGKKK